MKHKKARFIKGFVWGLIAVLILGWLALKGSGIFLPPAFYQEDFLFDWYHSLYLHVINLGAVMCVCLGLFEAAVWYRKTKRTFLFLTLCLIVIAGYGVFENRYAYFLYGQPPRIPVHQTNV